MNEIRAVFVVDGVSVDSAPPPTEVIKDSRLVSQINLDVKFFFTWSLFSLVV